MSSDSADSDKLEEWAPQRRHDVLLYRDGELQAAMDTFQHAPMLVANVVVRHWRFMEQLGITLPLNLIGDARNKVESCRQSKPSPIN